VRGNHRHYIRAVNTLSLPFDRKVCRGRWVTTRPVHFDTPDGRYEAADGTDYDRFSVVPDTGYIEFWKSSLLHDTARADKDIPRYVADYWFMQDMLKRMYSLGVSGKLGSIYIWLDRIF